MKYMETGRFDQHPLMRLTLALTLLFLLGLWLTNFGMYFSRMGLTADSVIHYYLGSLQTVGTDVTLLPPRSFESLLETTHAHLPIIGIVILFLTHLIIFAPFGNGTKVALITTAFLSALLNEGAGWLVRFVDPRFAYLKIGSFLLFQAAMSFMLITLAIFLWEAQKRSRAGGLDW